MDSIGSRLKFLRTREDKTQVEIAQDLGCSSGFVSQAERGKKNLGGGNLYAFADYFKVRREWLATGEGPMEDDSGGKPAQSSKKIPGLDDDIEALTEIYKQKNPRIHPNTGAFPCPKTQKC